jgi:hypothetical protein
VVRERERRHLELLRAGDEVADARQAVEEAVLAVGVQVDELARDADPSVARDLGSDPSDATPEVRLTPV